ncbi:MAG: T9SS type A sorting domain-containing protein [Flavobacteriales bacterium]
MKKLYSLLLAFSFGISAVQAQYCSPTFLNGCFNWTNQHIEVGGIVWDNVDCSISDYTSTVGTVTKGVATDMIVTNGAWCGVGVWLDFNNDYTFSDDENLYHIYDAGDPQTYNFQITVPSTVSDGSYRMRVIAGWGTDCFDVTSTNGYGTCGEYQYGNFNDFTINVVSPASVNTVEESALTIYPNPSNAICFVQADATLMGEHWCLMNAMGQVIEQSRFTQSLTEINTQKLTAGVYWLRVKGQGYVLIKE